MLGKMPWSMENHGKNMGKTVENGWGVSHGSMVDMVGSWQVSGGRSPGTLQAVRVPRAVMSTSKYLKGQHPTALRHNMEMIYNTWVSYGVLIEST